MYQSNRPLTLAEALQIDELLQDFVSTWKSHGAEVKGFAKVLFGHFILIMADEEATGVSGCSTDTSVRLIKSIGLDYNIDLFDRHSLAFLIRERIQLLPLRKVPAALQEGMISPDTLYFNNTVQSKQELLNNWIVPVKKSWLAKRFLSLAEQ